MQRAERLGLGTRTTATSLLREAPRREWRTAGARNGSRPDVLRWPVDVGAIGRGFGYVRHERPNVRHNGIDVATPRGMVIRAAADGIVAYADNGISGYGNVVLIVHPNGWVTLYGHQDRITVQPGWRVRRGERIGFVGATGRADGPHLHFELRVDGEPVDPVPHFVGEPWVEGRARLAVLRRDHGGHTYGHLGEIQADFSADAPLAEHGGGRSANGGRDARGATHASHASRAPRRARVAVPETSREVAAARSSQPASAPASLESTQSDAVPDDVARLLASGPSRQERLTLRSYPVVALEAPVRLEVDATFAAGVLRYRAPSATNVRAAASGRVAFVGRGIRSDRTSVVIVHTNGWVSVYTGIVDATVTVGTIVAAGDRIAIIRDDARGLEFEVFSRGRALDPRDQIQPTPPIVATRD